LTNLVERGKTSYIVDADINGYFIGRRPPDGEYNGARRDFSGSRLRM